jgi:hypothetical protein
MNRVDSFPSLLEDLALFNRYFVKITRQHKKVRRSQ